MHPLENVLPAPMALAAGLVNRERDAYATLDCVNSAIITSPVATSADVGPRFQNCFCRCLGAGGGGGGWQTWKMWTNICSRMSFSKKSNLGNDFGILPSWGPWPPGTSPRYGSDHSWLNWLHFDYKQHTFFKTLRI